MLLAWLVILGLVGVVRFQVGELRVTQVQGLGL